MPEDPIKINKLLEILHKQQREVAGLKAKLTELYSKNQNLRDKIRASEQIQIKIEQA